MDIDDQVMARVGRVDCRCWSCAALVMEDPSLLWAVEGVVKAWQVGPDGRTHWALSSGWDRAACGSRVLRRGGLPQL